MRRHQTNKKTSVHAIAGSYVVLLGFDVTAKAREGLLGFAIHRTDHTEDEQYWLNGFKTFKETMEDPTPGQSVNSRHHPIQGFMWGDYTAKPGHKYTYKVVPLYGKPTDIRDGQAVEVTISTENEDHGTHAVYFNRGVAGSQAYTRKFGNTAPETEEAFKWLSRGLEEALLGYIGQAKGRRYSLRAAVYEFNYRPALQAFKKASKSGADVKIVYDARVGKDKPVKASDRAIKEVGIRDLMTRRTKNKSYISHNKFVVLLKDGKPIEVWTGSTNFTRGGIFGQSNVGHVVRDRAVAQKYLDYWQQLSSDPTSKALRKWNDNATTVPKDLPPANSLTPIFSPRPTLKALEWYAERMAKAKEGVYFTAAFGINKLLVDVFKEDREYLRYLILDNPGRGKKALHNTKLVMSDKENRVAIGSYMETDELHRWLKERLTGFNNHVKYLHAKYMLLDPLGEDPLVISGSANFSDQSTKSNDENMVIVRGNTRVADMYLGEFMRLFAHFYFRDIANRQSSRRGSGRRKASYLIPDNSWTDPYFEKDSVRWKERLLFRGKTNAGHGITFFDIDETIFHTFAKIWIMKNGKVKKKLTNQEYNTYKLKAGESFDFREFGDAKLFKQTSHIIRPTLAKIKAMMKNALRTGSKLVLLTARSTFPDMATFKEEFLRYGINIDQMDINFAGDISAAAGSTAKAKKRIVEKYLKYNEYRRARLLDDDMANLKAFLSLAKDHPKVEFTAINIDKKGKTKTIKK